MLPKTLIPALRDMLGSWTSGGSSSPVSLTDFRELFNPVLAGFLTKKVGTYRELVDTPIVLETLDHAVSLVRDGGKRVRPYVSVLAYLTEGGRDRSAAIRTSVALELLHAFALVHDDVIDGGTERHGKLTTHEHVALRAASLPRGDKRHIGEGMAVLAGDLLFSWAHEVMANTENVRARELFFTMIEEVVTGQMLDVSLMLEDETSTATIRRKNELKTALYSFVNPMLIGAALAGSDERTAFYRSFGLLLGQAFQIQDDLLDITGDSKKTGKQTFLDVQEGQHTLLTQHVFEHGTVQDREVLRSLFGHPVDEHGRRVLAHLFESTGAIAYAREEARDLLARARALASSTTMDADCRTQWLALVALLERRQS